MPSTDRLPRPSHCRTLLPNRPATVRALAVSRHQHRASPVHLPLSLLAPQSLPFWPPRSCQACRFSLIEMPFVADARQATTDPVGQLLAAPELYPLPGPLPSRQWRVLRLSEEFSCHFSAPGREYMHLYECSYSHIKGHAVDRSWVSCLDNLDLNGASVVNAKLSRSREIVIASAAKQSRWRRVCPVGIASSLRSSQ